MAYGDIWISDQYGVCGSELTNGPADNSKKDFFSAYHMSCFQMWRKSIHETIGYYDEQFKCVADFDFQIRIALHYPFVKVDEPLGIYLEDQPHKLSFNGFQMIEQNIIYLRYGIYEHLNLFLLRHSKKMYRIDQCLFFDQWEQWPEKSIFGKGHKIGGLGIAAILSSYWLLRQIAKKIIYPKGKKRKRKPPKRNRTTKNAPPQMTILHPLFSLRTGGIETMLVDIINHQCRTANVALLIIKDQIDLPLLQAIDPRVSIFLLNKKGNAKLHFPSTFLRIQTIVKQLSPDVIHCHENTVLPFFIRWKHKTCLTLHATFVPTLFLKQYRKLFAISKAVQEKIKQRAGVDSQVIYNGIDLPHYQPRTTYSFNPATESFLIVQVSRLDPAQKGQPIAIQALHLLLKQHPNLPIHLHFVGSGPALPELQALTAQLHLQNHITFLGQKDRNWIKTHLQHYHLLIQPSLFEGFGLTVVEGLAAGLPILASDLDGPREIIHLLRAGLLTPPNDPAALAANIHTIYQSYLSNTLKTNRYILPDPQQLSLFDVRHTAAAYLAAYPSAVTSR
jgi:glycosyltransferase involved in cell wall biosynthesis